MGAQQTTTFRLARALLGGLAFCAALANAQLIDTVAGGGIGDGGQATGAPITSPFGVAVDAAGSLYVADIATHRVRKVTAGGVISTVAGNGTAGFSGDGGPATSAALSSPAGVAIDGAGNLYIADSENHRVRKVTTLGTISTVAGDGTPAFGGDAGPATSANLNYPYGVAFDAAGNLYIADSQNNRVRKVTVGGTISTVAGNGDPGYNGDMIPALGAMLNSPTGVGVDSAGNLFIADALNHRVRLVASGAIITVAGNGVPGIFGDGGPSTSANLNLPVSVVVAGAGVFYIGDSNNNRVRKVDSHGTITAFAGTGLAGFNGDGPVATSATLDHPSGVAVDGSGNVLIADQGNRRVRTVTPAGVISTAAGNGTISFGGDGAAATSAALAGPIGLAVGSASSVYIADTVNHRIRKVTAGGIISTVAGDGSATFSGDGFAATSATLNSPNGVAIDGAGNLYIADTLNHRIRKVTAGGVINTLAGNGTPAFAGEGVLATGASLNNPTGVAVDGAGNVYIADTYNNRVRRVTPGGVISTVAGEGTYAFGGDNGPATAASLAHPNGIAVDGAGNLYIADTENSRIRKVTAGGIISTLAGDGTVGFGGDGGPATGANLNYPLGVALDAAGNVYVADAGNNRLRVISVAGVIGTLAGNGTPGFSGDGGVPASASLNNPAGVAVASSGNYYIADMINNRIRKVTLAVPGAPTIGVVTAGVGQISVAFTPPASNGGSPVIDYTATCGGVSVVGPASPIVVTGLVNGTAYTCTVTARNIVGSSAPSAASGSATPTSIGLSVTKVGAGTGTVTSSPAGINCGATCSAVFVSGTLVTLTAVADSGFRFNGWSGGTGSASCTGVANCSVTLTTASSIVATFVPLVVFNVFLEGAQEVPFTLSTATGSGTATVDTAAKTITFNLTFTGMSGALTGAHLNGSAARGATAGIKFALNPSSPITNVVTYDPADESEILAGHWYVSLDTGGFPTGEIRGQLDNLGRAAKQLSVVKLGTGAGTVTATGIDCGVDCSESYAHGTPVTLTAAASAGSTFTGWSGSCAGVAATCNLTMDFAKTAQATFAAAAPVPPGAPTIGTATAGDAQISVAFTPPANNGGAPILDYTATCGAVSATGSGSPIVVTGLVNGTAYTCTVKARNVAGSSNASAASNSATPAAAVVNPPRLGNISTRMQVLAGNDVMIGGFVIGGSATKRVAIVATGPSLVQYGINNALANPTLTLVRQSDQTVIASNDDWQSAGNASQLTAAGFAPSHPLESAILIDLAPGAYTAIVAGAGGGTGVGIVAVYEVNHPEFPLINISTRGQVLGGNDVMIGGFIIQGNASQTVAIVATGPSLVQYGISNALANPTLTLVRQSDQTVIASNDDWQSGANASQLQSLGFAPSNPLESAILVTLPPGAYTAILAGKNGGTGVGIIGVYATP